MQTKTIQQSGEYGLESLKMYFKIFLLHGLFLLIMWA